MTECQLKHFAFQCEFVQPDYIHTAPVVLDYNLWRESHKTYAPPTSVTRSQRPHKQTNTGISTALTAENTLTYAHTTARTLTACDIILVCLTLPAPEAGDFVELILIYLTII
jgi:hypothetical protein